MKKENWEIKELGKVCKTQSGGTPLKMHKEYYEGGTIPWLRSGEVNKKHINKSELFITKLGLDNSSAKLFPINTVLVAMYGATAGQVGILDFETTTNQAICGILPNNRFIPEFLYYALLFNKDNIVKQAVGNAQPNISQIKIKQVKIPIPSLSEQQKIVDFLDSEFEKIDEIKANAEKNLEKAYSLYKNILHNVIKPKQNWKTNQLRDICDFYNGKAHEQCVTKNGKYIIINSKFISQNGTIKKYTDKQLFPLYKNDIAMVMSDVPKGKALAKCFIVDKDNLYSLNQRICAFRNSKINVNLLYYLINRNDYLLSFDNGENQSNLRKNDIEKMNISYPIESKDQQQIVDKLDGIMAKCTELEEVYSKTCEECDALKEALLRGVFDE